MECWWQRYPEKLREELEALERAGIEYTIRLQDEATGRMVIDLRYSSSGEQVNLEALYPIEYPCFPVLVNADGLKLPRHQNPVNKNLCLLGNPTGDWRVTETLAGLLETQFQRLRETAEQPDSDIASRSETHQGEPWSEYASYPEGAQIIAGDLQVPEDRNKGNLGWRWETQNLRGALMSISDEKNITIANTEPWIKRKYANCSSLQGKWIRTNQPPCIESAQAHFESVHPETKGQKNPVKNGQPNLAATLFPEETAWRHRQDGWIFSVAVPNKEKRKTDYHFLRPAQAGGALFARTPELHPLRDKHVLVVGLGMLGGAAALQLAKAGIGKLTLCDGDFVELGTISRWALGWSASSRSKALFLQNYIQAEYPYVHAKPINYRIGDPSAHANDQRRKLDEAIEAADLVFDATADFTVSNYLRLECLHRGKTHLWAETSPGCWGGVVGRYLPGKSGCWSCMKNYQKNGQIPVPDSMPGEDIQPAGCRTPTTTGTAFDSDVIVLEAVRMAASILSAGHENAYPKMNWDVGVVRLRQADGTLQPVSWETFPLVPHPECNHG